jgi:hypothetical protein
MSVGNLVANLGVNSKDFTKGLANAQSSASSFAGGLVSSLAPLAGLVAGIWGGAESVGNFKEALGEQKKLAAVMQATGGSAGVTADQINDYASELQSLTNFEGDATVGAAAMMTRFENIKGDMFLSTLDASADLAAVMGGDLVSATNLFGKAMDNPTEGLSKLKKAGIAFTEAEEQQIKSLQESGDLIGAQGMILDKVQSKFGGAAKAMADPWTIAKNGIGDVSEMIGSLLAPAFDVVAKGITIATDFIGGFGDTFLEVGVEAAAWMTVLGEAWLIFAEGVWTAIEPVINEVSSLFQWLFGDIIGSGGMSFQEMGIEAIVVMTNITGIIQLAAMQWGLAVVEFANDTVFMFTDKLPAVVSWFADNWTDILFTAVDYTLTIFINLGQNIRNMWSAVLEFIKGNGFEFDWTPLTEGARSAISKLPDIPERVSTEFEKSMKANIDSTSQGLGESMEKTRQDLTEGLVKSRETIAKAYDPTKNLTPSKPDEEDTPDAAASKNIKAAGAQERGSAAAYSTIAAAFMNKGKDPTVSAIEKQTNEQKKFWKENKVSFNVVESLGDA